MQAIETEYLCPTNYQGGRIRATCQAKSITVPWDYALGTDENHRMAACALLTSLGWTGRWAQGGNAAGTGKVFVQIPHRPPIVID
ncbi:MAG: hypothetical protein B7733_17015 [Myxococcales bacterium FL481]|nr:MAG: hypothetical protein B7733_17015 [Myxococcales bacterium FL481]